ncbi:MAG: RNA polymerase sigma factor [Acidobacteria bacterium]|nr:RNA polymerase sigma factor [Acidobacteriota bacterium]
MKAYQSLRTLEDSEKFPQWLFRIARNQAYSHFRRNSGFERMESWPEDDREDAIAAKRDVVIPLRPGGALLDLEVELTVSKALEALTPEQREAIVLKVYQGFQFAEIAEILSCPVSTVKSRIYAGFERLKEMLTTSHQARVAPPQAR